MMFLARHPMVFIFLNLFDLLECPAMLMTLIPVIRFEDNNKVFKRRNKVLRL